MPDNSNGLAYPGAIARRGCRDAAAQIRFLVLDVDGVCTDGKLLYLADGTTCKMFHSQDGIGIQTALKAGLGIGVITGRDDASVRVRMTQLGVTEYVAGHSSKLGPLKDMARRQGIKLEHMAYLGDDWIDLDPMRAVGLPIAVANARPEVKQEALYVTETAGGNGAVREAVEFLLSCRETPVDMAALWTTIPKAR